MMFCSTFRNTVKTLARSWVFWIAFCVLAIVTVPTVWERPVYAEGLEQFAPTALGIWEYYQHTGNLFNASFLKYALPVFAVISVVLVLNRDYGDQFYEIEKAAGVKPAEYLAGRLCAVVSVQTAIVLLWSTLLLHAYVIGCGGVDGMSLGAYLIDSAVRICRWTIAASLPCILVCVGLTYFIGALFRSGLVASIGGLGYVIFHNAMMLYYVPLVLTKGFKPAKIYFHYLSYRPNKLIEYLFTVESGGGGILVQTSLGEALLCIGFLVGLCLLCSIVSYFLLRRREI